MDQPRVNRLLAHLCPPGTEHPATEGGATDHGRRRLIALLVLFDALLIAAVLLSFQAADLVEEERTLLETRTFYEIIYRDQLVTQTEVITRILPYGSVP
jgi:hypothetical protein